MSEEKPTPKAVNEQLPLTENLQAKKIEAKVASHYLSIGTDEVATPSSPATPSQPVTVRAADGIAAGDATAQAVGATAYKAELESGRYELKGGTLRAEVRAKVRLRPIDEMLNDPLREVTRKERRSLLGISAIALLIGWTHARVVPSKIENFGITDLTAPDRSVLLWLFLWIVGYYFVAFVVYAATDFLKYFHTMDEGAKTLSKQRDERVIGSLKLAAEAPWWLGFVVPASLVRGIFDFFITVAIAGVAMYALWGAVHQVATTAPSATAPPAVAPSVPHGTAPSLKVAPVPATR